MTENKSKYQGNWQAALAYSWQEGYRKGYENAQTKAAEIAQKEQLYQIRMAKESGIAKEIIARIFDVALHKIETLE